MTHVTCRLTAKNRDQLRNPTLGNRVWATFTFLGRVKLLLKRYTVAVSQTHAATPLVRYTNPDINGGTYDASRHLEAYLNREWQAR